MSNEIVEIVEVVKLTESTESAKSTIVEVQIEIPKNNSVKYEYDHVNNKLICDRILHGPFTYLFNYGYIVDTLSPDGDPLDCIVLCEPELYPTCHIKCRIIGALITEDEKGGDDKIIVVPDTKIDPDSKDINNISDVSTHLISKIKYFFEHYKDLEEGKFVKVKDFVSASDAIEIYKKCKSAYLKN